MKNYWKVLFFLGLQLLAVSSFAQQIDVNSLRYTTTSKQNRLLFDLTAATEHKVFVMENPSRLVIDIKNAQLNRSLKQPSAEHPLFSRVRAGTKNETNLRIVVDLKTSVDSKKFSLKSTISDENRLVIDVFNKEPIVATKAGDKEATQLVSSKSGAGKTSDAKKSNSIVIAIDPGHGGNDSGARGPHGTEEKKITFAIAKKLEALINEQTGMRAVMVRKGDYYVGLRDRMQIARAAKADLFVSIHADAFKDTDVKGASVYTLSTSGASSEAARWLADSENASDLVGVSLSDKEDVLASVLLDLSQTATQEASVNVANHVLKSFDNIAELHKSSVQKAGFIVLKSPDIPSILVETAFISNPSEEQKLLSAQYQSKIAQCCFQRGAQLFQTISAC